MKNYDISQNGIDRYQDEVDRMEETEADEPEDIDYDEVDFSKPDDEEIFRAQNEEFDRQMELEQRPFVSWQLSQCCLDIAESLDVLEKSIRKKPYYGMMMKHYNNCAKAPLADTISVLSYESEKQRLDKKLEEQKKEAGITEPKNLEEQAISLVGKDIFEKLIKGYTEKWIG